MRNQIETFKSSKHFLLNNVAEGVFAAISVPGTGSVGNAAIIDLGGLTLVVDTFQSIQAAEDLKAAAMYLTGNSVSYVINTHWHSDHTSGNQVFTPGAQIISTCKTRKIMDEFGKNRLAQQLSNPEPIYQAIDELEEKIKYETDEKLKKQMQWENASDREYMKILHDLVYTLPAITFNQQLTIQGSNRSAQLITYGGGHTPSDAFVYIPEEKIAVMGDLVLSKHHPVLFDSNPQEWLNILEQVELLDIETIVPGHGEVCSMKELHEVKGYINNIVALVVETVQSKRSLDDILVPKAYQEWYFTTYFKANLKKVYELITKSVG
ncbi:MBL fold metallo-hydrolase [Bacillus pseudomycoides]|uniref:MBL fold metallo-hydrolase n=1 Tax=Bacillus pseudomycoides TaxID=64104 RepID=A0AA91VA49_9BACI|nr:MULTISPECIES: MBL fold metallo-hydrolase [Bacillus]PEB50084.1 MBL fold metallo-hydrolase [Bacillus sp. AFS098217]PED81392.1 MBL fold metallo-hydrolase [Bacillus pseudomycoides]PEU07434.1 MBL fold metallo-hydrolase [Bacillus sp. AFS014408]PEU13460.1 MBL fold metallo-hydrolase [Bacillus sp. AFS019443]PFW55812.1 MBL fold metallo-hydrolase [Bacillus sp. AFS075034]